MFSSIPFKLRTASLLAGLCLIGLWTVLRFFNQPYIMDLFGQQAVAQQWLHGHHSGVYLGATHYLLKIFIFYIPLYFLPGDPLLKLIVLTVVVNLLTFWLIFRLLEAIMKLFKLQPNKFFYLLMIWFASIAGSVYWIQFTNFRNLEVAGGLAMVFLALKYCYKPTRSWLVLYGLVSFIVLFSDNLQVYMTLLPLLLFVTFLALKKTISPRSLVALASVTVTSIILSRLLLQLLARLFSIKFLQPAQWSFDHIFSAFPHAVSQTAKWFAVLYSGGVELPKPIQLLNIAIMALFLTGSIVLFIKNTKMRPLVGFCLGVIIFDVAAYFFSSYELLPSTSRYLIMTAPFILIAGTVLFGWLKASYQTVLIGIVGLAVVLNSLIVVYNFASSTSKHTNQKARIQSITEYIKKNHYKYALTSQDSAIPGAYLLKQDGLMVPVTCISNQIAIFNLFFDKSINQKLVASPQNLVPIITDKGQIINNPYKCTSNSIAAQLGKPLKYDSTNDGSDVLIYSKKQLYSKIQSLSFSSTPL